MTNKRKMFGTEEWNRINPAVHTAVVPTEIHIQIKITISKRESITIQSTWSSFLQQQHVHRTLGRQKIVLSQEHMLFL
jgi:hypothetical protein